MLRLCMVLVAACLATASAAEDKPEDLLRLGFFPPMDEEIVYRVEHHHTLDFRGRQKVTQWSHEISLRLTGKEPPDLLAGTFSMRAVKPGPGVESDITYMFARAIEGESFAFKMLEAGAPVEIDWPAVKRRILERLPGLTTPEIAAAMTRVISIFDPDGVAAVMRPFWVSSVAYLRGFRRDGQVSAGEGLKVPAWFPVPGARLEVYGGREEGTADMLFIWRFTTDPAAAARTLGSELVALVGQAAGPGEAAKTRAEIEAAVAKGVTAVEGGFATYDLTPGLMRTVEFEARLVAGDLSRRVQFEITRVKPE